jgi:hypothetical protein
VVKTICILKTIASDAGGPKAETDVSYGGYSISGLTDGDRVPTQAIS